MADKKMFDIIGELAEEVNKCSILPIVAKRLDPSYDSSYDYRNHKWLCPFHNDSHKGNFDVRKNFFKCYSCGEGGNAITFVRKFDNKTFPEAVLTCALELEIIDEQTYEKLSKNKSNGISYVKKNLEFTKKQNNLADRETMHKVFSLFIQGNTLLGKDKLSESHLDHLKNVRNLSDEQIEKVGYFTFPSLYVMKHILKGLKTLGLDEEVLKHIPGFYYDEKKGKFTFVTLNKNKGIGIPIRDVDGYIVGIQIRLDNLDKNSNRYIWFSSSFADTGCSPGTPVDVCYPNCVDIPCETVKDVQCQIIFITEGHFKAIRLSNAFNAIALSVQGVHNWRTIPYVLDTLKQYNPNLKHIYIMYDADMSFKETVLQPGIKLGLSLTNLDFKDCKVDVEDILAINSPNKKPLSELEPSYLKVDSYLRENAGIFKFDIQYCLWDEEIGKGIDDFFDAFSTPQEAVKNIKKLQLIEFWDNIYYYLLANETEKKYIALRDGCELYEVILDEDIKKDNFMRKVFNKC